MTNLESVKLKIQELVPEVMKLKFGCEVQIGKFQMVVLQKNYAGNYLLDTLMGTTTTKKEKQFTKILGSPITLAVVLRAINTGNWFVDDNGFFIKAKRSEFTYDYVQPNVRWNLADDNLDHQSPETINFLASLLGN